MFHERVSSVYRVHLNLVRTLKNPVNCIYNVEAKRVDMYHILKKKVRMYVIKRDKNLEHDKFLSSL